MYYLLYLYSILTEYLYEISWQVIEHAKEMQ